MKLFIQKLLNFFGYQISKVDKKRSNTAVNISHLIPEINPFEEEAIRTCLKYSMTNAERMWAIIQSLKLIADKNILGDIVECGVWRGGNILLFSLLLKKYDLKKNIWAHDTYEGMSEPTVEDVNFRGIDSKKILEQEPKVLVGDTHNIWCYSTIDEVQKNILAHVDDIKNIRFIKGKVEETLKHEKNLPKQISLLRLDTDWYESTKVELEVLYPRLVSGGILIIDDYGHWRGSKKAVDEYFAGKNIFLHRVDYTCRLLIKE